MWTTNLGKINSMIYTSVIIYTDRDPEKDNIIILGLKGCTVVSYHICLLWCDVMDVLEKGQYRAG